VPVAVLRVIEHLFLIRAAAVLITAAPLAQADGRKVGLAMSVVTSPKWFAAPAARVKRRVAGRREDDVARTCTEGRGTCGPYTRGLFVSSFVGDRNALCFLWV
jgi:hypothetical protein